MLRSFPIHHIRRLGYAPLLALGMAVMFARLPIMAKLLDLQEFSTLGACLVVSTFVMIGCSFGFYVNLQRTLPVLLLRGQKQAAAGQISQTMMAAAVGGLIGIMAGLFGLSLGGISAASIAFGSLHGLIQHMFLIVTLESRSSGNALLYAKQHLARSLLTLAAGVAAGVTFRMGHAVVAAEIAAGAISIIIVLTSVRRRLGAPVRLAVALALRSSRQIDWGVMLTLLAYTLLASFTVQLDRLLASTLLPSEQFAQYSFAWIIIMLALSVQALISASVYPTIVRRLATDGALSAFQLTRQLSFLLLLGSLILAGPAIWAANIIIARFFPQFADSTLIIPVIVFAAILKVSDFWSGFLIAAGHEKSILLTSIGTIAFVLFVWTLTTRASNAMLGNIANLGLALALISYAVNFLLSWRAATKVKT